MSNAKQEKLSEMQWKNTGLHFSRVILFSIAVTTQTRPELQGVITSFIKPTDTS